VFGYLVMNGRWEVEGIGEYVVINTERVRDIPLVYAEPSTRRIL